MTAALTPAEALVLVKGVNTAPEALKATLTMLIAQGVIRIETARGWLGLRKTKRVRKGGAAPESPGFVADIVDIAHTIEARGGGLESLARALRRRYGPGFRRLTRRGVVTALEARGLVSNRRLRVLGVPLWRRLRLTPEGRAEKKRIEQELAKARRLPALMRKDRIAGMSAAVGIGALFVLLPELRPFYGELSAGLRQQAGETQGAGTETGKAVFDADFSALDSLDAALGAVTAQAAAASGGDDGGDGAGLAG